MTVDIAADVVGAGTQRPLPTGWRWVRIGDVCPEAAMTLDPRKSPSKPFRYIDISTVDNMTKRIVEPKTLLGRDAPSRARQIINVGDVLVSTTRPNLNAVAVVPSDLDGEICSTGFCVLRGGQDIDPSFLFVFVRSSGFVSELTSLVKGALYPAVTDKQVRSLWIPLPPLKEQRRIAALLREQMEAVERAHAAVGAQLVAARALPAAYLRMVFGSDEARAWPRVRLREICRLLPSRSIATIGDTEVTAITTACLSETGFLFQGVKPARMWARDVADSTVEAGEILVARSNTADLVGRSALFTGLPSEVVASDLVIRLWVETQDYPPFIAAFLSFLYISGYWKERAGGASGSMKKITRTQLERLTVPLPEPNQQHQVAIAINAHMAEAQRIRSGLEEQLAAINALPAALLQRAFNGEL